MTVTVTVAKSEQPETSVPVTVYTVDTEGFTTTLALVTTPGFHV